MQCARCAKPLLAGALFCPACGLPVATNSALPTGESASIPSAGAPARNAAPTPADYAFQEFHGAPAYFPPAGMPGAPAPYPMPALPGKVPYPPFAVPSVPAPAQPKRRGRSMGCIVLYALLAILLLFAGLGVALYAVGAHFAAASRANQAAAMRLYQQVTSEAPAIMDTLTNPSQSLWTPYQESNYGCSLENDGLHARITQKNYFAYCTDHADDLTDCAFQVQMQILSGDGGGLVFRMDDVAKTFYYLALNPSNGSYSVMLEKNGLAGQYSTLIRGVTSAAHAQAGASNTLTVIAQGAQFDFYVNGQFLVQVHDATYKSGNVGLLAIDQGNPTEVVYTNARIWRLIA